MTLKWKFSLLAAASAACALLFIFWNVIGSWDYVVPRRSLKIAAIILTGGAIAFSTVVFQTLTNNRILTPSIIGLDSLYMLIQTGIIFLYGSASINMLNKNINFFVSAVCMILFAGLLYRFLFRREGQSIYFLLLVGIILGTFFGSVTTFMQVLLDPNEFAIVQDRMFASFNNVNTDLLVLSVIVVALVSLYSLRFTKYLDVLSLGREHAVNLGVNYDHVVKRLLMVVAVLISVATALVGPITFLGLLVANVAYQFFGTYRHSVLIPGSMLISIIALTGGQFIVERIFTFSTTLSVIINFVGGVYFIYLLLRENKS
ncbi:iron chelate uptake ABC transporter family permease subunit [Paenibacillus tarimensis]|uniref:iron chelate uptake ABC transporter family permease subunit n=1 Tax=Paenibacillus tarimensis TaxID=416012 RepID=UPI001F2A83AF|nr:iron chelate uptake ABC transporter family permease subunit [Paenibacillus tarimensis]MCF2943479.1 iron chelate uptake ABC transporter family permease subunit [Paenibacillus tarimensis]